MASYVFKEKNVNLENYTSNESGEASQTDIVITQMWSRMKNLESRYIDLANYYKQELVSTKQIISGQR